MYAGLEVDRVEPVDEHEAGDHAVLDEQVAHLGGTALRQLERGKDPLEPLAVELHDRSDELVGHRAPLEILELLELLGERLDALDERAGGVDRHHGLSSSRSACAPPCAPCPCRTCAPRRAGTGR